MRAIIIGGGIAGPVLGMWLRRVGYEVVIAERRSAPSGGRGAFLGVAPNGMNVLRDLGVAGAVAAKGSPCAAFEFVNGSGRPIGAIDRSADQEHFGAALTMIRRGDLHEVLLEAARDRGAEVRFGAELSALDASSPETVTARFADGTSASGDFLIGCDGLRSKVRALCFADGPAPAPLGLWDAGGFVGGLQVPLRSGVNRMVFGQKAFFGAFVTPGGEVWWFHNGPEGSDTALSREDLRQRLLSLHAGDSSWIRDCIEATPEILGPWPIGELTGLARWSSGRVCLLGDAAHAMSPSAGQGASMALEDAMLLAMSLRDLEDPARAFRVFERIRRPRVEKIARQARRNGNGKAMESRLAVWLRDRLMPLFLRFGARAQDESYAYRIFWETRLEDARPGRAEGHELQPRERRRWPG